jgi:hypothetical protein
VKGFIISIVFLVVLVVLFIVGTINQSTALMISGFCLFPVAFFAAGWTTSRLFAGRRLALVSMNETNTTPRKVTVRTSREVL